MDVSVIIVNYNTRELLQDCIQSIKEKTKGLEYEIIVVDNQSSDGSLQMLSDKFPDVKAIDAKGNLGFGRANNLGMQHAEGKYFFLLNSDTILKNNALKIFFDYAENSDPNNVLGAILTGKDGTTSHSYGALTSMGSELKWSMAKYLRFLKDENYLHPCKIKKPIEVGYIIGADIWVPRKVFQQTSGFDPDFFLYCEEVDWQKRMDNLGVKRTIIPGPDIIHLEGGSDDSKSRIWSPTRLTNLYISKKIYHKKHLRNFYYPLFRLLYVILNIPSIILLSILKRDKRYMKIIKLL